MHWYGNLNTSCYQTKYVLILSKRQILKLLNQNLKIKNT